MSAFGQSVVGAMAQTPRPIASEDAASLEEQLKSSVRSQDWKYHFADGTAYYKGARNWDSLRARAVILADAVSDEYAANILNETAPAAVLTANGRFNAGHVAEWREMKRRGGIRA